MLTAAYTSARGLSPWRLSAIFALIAFAVLVLRMPEAVFRAEFWADDGHQYQDALDHGPITLVWPYAGTLLLPQRVIVAVESLVPPPAAPLIANLAALVAIALVAAFLASPRMSSVLPDKRWRLVLGLSFVLIPAAARMLGTLSNLQWTTNAYLVAMLVATPPTSAKGRWGDTLGLIVAGLNGPGGIVLLPLFALRAWREPWARWHAYVLALTAIAQALIYTQAVRMAPADPDLALLPEVMLVRDVLVPLGGSFGLVQLNAALPLALLVLAAVLIAVVRLPSDLRLGAAYIAIVIPLAGIRQTETGTATLLADPLVGGRYFYLTGFVLIALIVIALARKHYWAVPAACIVAIGMVADFRVPAVPATGWYEAAACIRGPVPCTVAVAPSSEWDVHWLTGP